MQLDIKIEDMVARAIGDALSPEKLQTILHANVERAVKDCIETQFAYRSAFREQLTKSISAVMPTDFGDLANMADLILKTVEHHVNQAQHDFIAQAVVPRLQSLLEPVPETIKLSELVKALHEHFVDDPDEKNGDRPTFFVTRSENIDGYWTLAADPRSEVGMSSYGRHLSNREFVCKYRLSFNREGECYSLKIAGQDPNKQLMIGPAYNAERYILNLYIGKTRVELDRDDFEDDDDLRYPNDECTC